MATSLLSNILFELLDEPICNFTTYPPTTHNFHSTPPRTELERLAELRDAQQLTMRVQLATYRRVRQRNNRHNRRERTLRERELRNGDRDGALRCDEPYVEGLRFIAGGACTDLSFSSCNCGIRSHHDYNLTLSTTSPPPLHVLHCTHKQY